ncbi:glycosyl hydrolase [Trichodelitschia bisporula]|uniref:Glycosyl hydrolase n=1 Tax=Trichodelitschia bisporula TaxID=703511 RepID=A0A6G1HKE3_9PEZI|nr:glycosyl hydrolase [Trichodelitschia bisporula]
MLPFLPLLLLLPLAPAALPPPPQNQTYATWMASSILARGQGLGLNPRGRPAVSYEHGTFQTALLRLHNATGEARWLDAVRRGLDTIVRDEGRDIAGYDRGRAALDDIRVGEGLLVMYERTRNASYLRAAALLHDQLATQPRTPEGGFWHKRRYAQQQWLDGVYMAQPFYARWAVGGYEARGGQGGGAERVWSDVGTQFRVIWAHCADRKTGLLRHGYDYSRKVVWADPVSGASPEVWGRAVGWYVMALVDLLAATAPIPAEHPTYALLLGQLRLLLPRVADAADKESGGWALVVSQPINRPGNYMESSGSLMFVYALLRAVRLDLVEDPGGRLVGVGRRGFESVVKRYLVKNRDGTVSLEGTVRVGSLDEDGDFEYYTKINRVRDDLKGTAPFVLAALEYEMLRDR